MPGYASYSTNTLLYLRLYFTNLCKKSKKIWNQSNCYKYIGHMRIVESN